MGKRPRSGQTFVKRIW